MSVFFPKRKRKDSVPVPYTPPEKTCDHKWKDFNWFIAYDDIPVNGVVTYTIYEPYVCIHCKELKEVILETGQFRARGMEDVEKKINKIREKYPLIKPIAIVQDEINDLQLVDRDYLRIASQVMGVKL